MPSRTSAHDAALGTPAQIPALPGLGTTWYQRGARYWARRVLAAVLWLIVMAFVCYVGLQLYGSFRAELPPALRTVWDRVQVVGSCVTLVWGWLVQRRDHHRKLLDPPTPGQARRARLVQAGHSTRLALAGRVLLLIATPVLPAYLAYCVGWLAAAFTVREYPSEVGARRALEARTGHADAATR